MRHVKPVPVILRRWGASISASLVLLACGGAADLQLGQDSSALEGAADGPPSAEPTRDAEVATPTGATDSVQSPELVPGQAYLVDPATGQAFLPCQAPLPDGAATGEPVSDVPVVEPLPANDEPAS